MKTKGNIFAVVCVILITALCVTCNVACTNSSYSSESSSPTLQEQYNADIDELDNLVSEIVRLEYQYLETRDETIAERGENGFLSDDIIEVDEPDYKQYIRNGVRYYEIS